MAALLLSPPRTHTMVKQWHKYFLLSFSLQYITTYNTSCIDEKNYSFIVTNKIYYKLEKHSESADLRRTFYAPFKVMLTKISKWSRIQDSFRITPEIESLVVFAILNIPCKFQKDPSISFWVILLTHRQTNKLWQKHNLFGGGKNFISLSKLTLLAVSVQITMD